MRRTTVVGVLVGAAVVVGSPALAAPPEISQRSCDEAGGTFSREQGVKSCTTTSSTTSYTGGVVLQGEPEQAGFLQYRRYTGVTENYDVVVTSTTRSQKGNGEVTTTVVEDRSTRSDYTCYEETLVGAQITSSEQVSTEPCVTRGLLPAP